MSTTAYTYGVDYGNGKSKTVTIKVIKHDPALCYKKPLLIYPPGGRPLESWNDWRKFV